MRCGPGSTGSKVNSKRLPPTERYVASCQSIRHAFYVNTNSTEQPTGVLSAPLPSLAQEDPQKQAKSSPLSTRYVLKLHRVLKSSVVMRFKRFGCVRECVARFRLVPSLAQSTRCARRFGAELNFPVVEWLSKGLTRISSGAFTTRRFGRVWGSKVYTRGGERPDKGDLMGSVPVGCWDRRPA
eukprot:1184480-Prorocentrum_minimum.AAC.1